MNPFVDPNGCDFLGSCNQNNNSDGCVWVCNMVDIIGYGEDALTYWALSTRLEWMLKELDDNSKPDDCLVLYRPSFGRSGGPNSAQFGEFDAILATPVKVYLIESKWGGSSEIKDGKIHLRDEQTLRHKLFHEYRALWETSKFNNWLDFYNKFQGKILEKKIAPSGSKLARNLERILRTLLEYSRDTQNVLLYFHRGDQEPPRSVDQGFQLILCHYEGNEGTDLFKMN